MPIEVVFYHERGDLLYDSTFCRMTYELRAYFVKPLIVFSMGRDEEVYSAVSKGYQVFFGSIFKKPGTVSDFFVILGDLVATNPASGHWGNSGSRFADAVKFFQKIANIMNDADESGETSSFLDDSYDIDLERLTATGNNFSYENLPTSEQLRVELNKALLPSLITAEGGAVLLPSWTNLKLADADRDSLLTEESTSDELSAILTYGALGIPPERFVGEYQVATTSSRRPVKVGPYELIKILHEFVSKYRTGGEERHMSYLNSVYSVLSYCHLHGERHPASLLSAAVVLSDRFDKNRIEIKPVHFDAFQWVERLPDTVHYDYCMASKKGGDSIPFKFLSI